MGHQTLVKASPGGYILTGDVGRTGSATNRDGDIRFYGDTTSATLPLAFPWQSSFGGGYDQYLAGFRF